VRGLVCGLGVLVLAGCGTTAASLATPTTSASPPVPTATASASGSESGLPALPTYNSNEAHHVPAGKYVTGDAGFFPGFVLKIPEGWTLNESTEGEIKLHPDDRSDAVIYFWKDLAPVVTNNRDGTVGQVLEDGGRSRDDVLRWLTTTSDFEVVEGPKQVSVGASIQGTLLVLRASDTANFGDDGCPDNPRCAAIFTDPRHFVDDFYAIGGDELARIFIASAHYLQGDHTLFVVLDAPNHKALDKLAVDAQPILNSLRLPATYTDN
jgi:hypothetical protein